MVTEQKPETDKKIEVNVTYTGHDDYSESFPKEVPLGTIKRKALKEFDIEQNAADNYVLQLNGTNLDDKTKIGDLNAPAVNLVLTLKKPQEKGYGR